MDSGIVRFACFWRKRIWRRPSQIVTEFSTQQSSLGSGRASDIRAGYRLGLHPAGQRDYEGRYEFCGRLDFCRTRSKPFERWKAASGMYRKTTSRKEPRTTNRTSDAAPIVSRH